MIFKIGSNHLCLNADVKMKSIQDVINKEAGKGPTISGAERLRLLIAKEH